MQVNHVGISVADLATARRFWVEALGAEEHGAFGWPAGTAPADESLAVEGTSAEVVLLRTDAAFMELFAFATPAPEVRASSTPGISAVHWACDDVDATHERALAAGGRELASGLACPDGTPVHLRRAADGPRGLVGVEIRVEDPEAFVFDGVTGPVEVAVVAGADGPAARPVDLGANHVCLDVHDAAAVRSGASSVVWHHPVTESSGGLAAVCYGTTVDGVLVELLESRSDQAFFSRSRLHAG